jgi:hypothetical protein
VVTLTVFEWLSTQALGPSRCSNDFPHRPPDGHARRAPAVARRLGWACRRRRSVFVARASVILPTIGPTPRTAACVALDALFSG